jgi:hypothetical protein
MKFHASKEVGRPMANLWLAIALEADYQSDMAMGADWTREEHLAIVLKEAGIDGVGIAQSLRRTWAQILRQS